MSAVVLGLMLTGCATVKTPGPPSGALPVETPLVGVTHKVHKGETLWRIARAYRVSVDDIIRSNRIPVAATIEEGQLLFIPGVTALVDVPPLAAGSEAEFVWPVQGRVLEYFGDRKGGYVNRGIDVQGEGGDVVRAVRAGSVVFADHLPGYGPTLILDHGDGFFTVYSRGARLLVGVGDKVFRGETIAQLGPDGIVHLEFRRGGQSRNPLLFLPREM